MRSPEAWRSSVFSFRNGRWQTSLDTSDVEVWSRVATQLAARAYSEAIDHYAHGALVDLGCGQLPCYGMYATHVDSVICLDWDSSPHNLPHVDVLADLNKPLPLKDGSFDTILLTDVIEHVNNPSSLWGELARIARPNGTLIVGVPFMYWLHEQPHDFYRYTEYALRHLCHENGFDVQVLRATGDNRAVLADVTIKALTHVLPLRMIGVLSRLAIRLLDSGRELPTMPIGYLLVAIRRGERIAPRSSR